MDRQQAAAASGGRPRLSAATRPTVPDRQPDLFRWRLPAASGMFAPNDGPRSRAARRNAHEPDEARGRDRRQRPAVHRRGIPRKPARRPRGLYLRRARRGRHHASGVPQRGALDRAALRRAARSQAQGRADLPDRHRLGRLHPQVLPRRALARGPDRPARGDRRLGAHVLRLDGAHAGLQGVADEHARRPTTISTGSSPTTRRPGTGARRTTSCS